MTDSRDRTVLSEPDASLAAAPDEAYCPACNESFGVDLEVCPNDRARLIRLRSSRDVLIGRVFDDRYELLSQLGHGGMGTVYRAHQISVDREVAIKVIHPKHASDRLSVKRFLREARLASRLNQPNIVNVYDFGQTDDGILYLVMELLRGHTLATELDARGALALRRVCAIGLQLCDALESAHNQGIVHRDLKPSNILLLAEPPGRDLLKVLDFGLAKSLVSDTSTVTTHSGSMLGTPLYMPPEQIDGRLSDQRSDLYALGCILHHLLSGTPPFLRDNVNQVLTAHVNDPVPPLPAHVSGTLAQHIASLMAKRPEDRPSSAASVRDAIQGFVERGFGDFSDTVPVVADSTVPDLRGLAVTTSAPRGPAVPATWVGPARPRWLRRIAPVVLVAIGGAIGFATLGGGHRPVAVPALDAPPARAIAQPPSDAAVTAPGIPSAPEIATSVVDTAARPVGVAPAASASSPDAGMPRSRIHPPPPASGSAHAPPRLPSLDWAH
jgi:serine/threonine-protein kinase